MVKPEIARKWRVEKVTRVVAEAISDFSEGCHNQVNLSAPSARKDLAERITFLLSEKGLIGRSPSREKN